MNYKLINTLLLAVIAGSLAGPYLFTAGDNLIKAGSSLNADLTQKRRQAKRVRELSTWCRKTNSTQSGFENCIKTFAKKN